MVEYDPYLPEVMADPYPVYKRMRAEQPVYYLERFDAWALALFQDIWDASGDPEHYSTRNSTADLALLERKPAEIELLTHLDPPQHTELRKQLFAYFSPRAARKLEGDIRRWTIDCLDQHRDGGSIDAIGELAQQVAVRVACRVSGFPMEDADYLVDLVTRFFAREEGTEGMPGAGFAARSEIAEYLAQVARERSPGPERRDVLDLLLGFRDEKGIFTPERVGQHLLIMLVGATETLPKVFASGLLRLWQHPDQRTELVKNPKLIPTAFTEILRYDMPTQWLGRTVIKDHRIRENQLRSGQPILFLYPSGNRDEREFDRPDVFEIHRNPTRIISFGHGIHRCLGAFIARVEGQVMLEETLARFPDYEVLEDQLVLPPSDYVRGYAEFPIAFSHPAR